MKKNTLFIAMLAILLGLAFSAKAGALSLIVPSAMANDAGKATHKEGAKDQVGAEESHDGGEDASGTTCTCPPGITSCICPDGSTGLPSAGSLSTTPGSLRSVYGK